MFEEKFVTEGAMIVEGLQFYTCCLHVVVPSQVYALVGSEQKGQVLGGMVAAGAGKLTKSNLLLPVFHTFSRIFCF